MAHLAHHRITRSISNAQKDHQQEHQQQHQRPKRASPRRNAFEGPGFLKNRKNSCYMDVVLMVLFLEASPLMLHIFKIARGEEPPLDNVLETIKYRMARLLLKMRSDMMLGQVIDANLLRRCCAGYIIREEGVRLKKELTETRMRAIRSRWESEIQSPKEAITFLHDTFSKAQFMLTTKSTVTYYDANEYKSGPMAETFVKFIEDLPANTDSLNMLNANMTVCKHAKPGKPTQHDGLIWTVPVFAGSKTQDFCNQVGAAVYNLKDNDKDHGLTVRTECIDVVAASMLMLDFNRVPDQVLNLNMAWRGDTSASSTNAAAPAEEASSRPVPPSIGNPLSTSESKCLKRKRGPYAAETAESLYESYYGNNSTNDRQPRTKLKIVHDDVQKVEFEYEDEDEEEEDYFTLLCAPDTPAVNYEAGNLIALSSLPEVLCNRMLRAVILRFRNHFTAYIRYGLDWFFYNDLSVNGLERVTNMKPMNNSHNRIELSRFKKRLKAKDTFGVTDLQKVSQLLYF